ncbi:hypothetical protein GCM10008967_27310 [Bacillus carboniphilus]|uniref:DUF4230 domain-containing protein n=1 Tax=Bacillus carboniphilus TaxID=86663 RepID=A0ABN0WER9_9BACI
MSKNESTIAQLESVLEELKEGQKEQAATATMGSKIKSPKLSGAIFNLIFRFWGIRILLLIGSLLVVIITGIGLFTGSTFKKESTPFVEHIQDLATLATAEAHIKVILEQEDNKLFGKDIKWNIPGTKRELLLVVPATVIAGVDLQEIRKNDVQVNEKKKEISIVLPQATFIQPPAIQMDQVKTFSDEGLFRGQVEWAEGFDLAAEAQATIEKEAIEVGLLEKAEISAEKVLNEFFGHLGYTVNVSYK